LAANTTVSGSSLLGPQGSLCSSDFGHRDGQSTAAVGTTATNAGWRTPSDIDLLMNITNQEYVRGLKTTSNGKLLAVS